MFDWFAWLEFIFAVAVLMYVARKSLWLALTISALIIGFLSLTHWDVAIIVRDTLSDPSILLLSLSVGLIAVIGGAMERAGLMNDLVENVRMSRRLSVFALPGFLGMLPIPGGAVLSAPLINRAAPDLKGDMKTAINVWARHTTLLVYPLGALLATTKLAGLDLYTQVVYMIPFLIFNILIINFLMLRKVDRERVGRDDRSFKKLLIPIMIIGAAPAIHAILMFIFPDIIEEWFLLLGVLISLLLSFWLGDLDIKYFVPVSRKMKAWNFSLIILGMFLFLNLFNESDIPDAIADLPFTESLLIVTAGSILGFATGRINVPLSVLIPIIGTRLGGSVDHIAFSLMFFAVFIGYLMSPVHPCVSVSLQAFRVSYMDMFKRTWLPALIALAVTTVAAMILL